MKVNKKDNRLTRKLKRRMEDVPFYAYEHTTDDLPLDPARPFILDQIERVRKTRSISIFGDDLSFRARHSSTTGEAGGQCNPATASLSEMPLPGTDHNSTTAGLVKLWKMNGTQYSRKTKRESPAEMKRRLRRKFLPRIESFSPYELVGIKKFHVANPNQPLRKSSKYQYKPLPSVSEMNAEMIRAEKIIEKMLRPHHERYERIKDELDEYRKKSYTTMQEIMENHARKISLEKQEKSLKKPTKKLNTRPTLKKAGGLIENEQKMLKEIRQIMPAMGIDSQRERILNVFARTNDILKEKFSTEMEQRFLVLKESICANDIQLFPSNWILKSLPNVNPRLHFLKEAADYCKQMSQLDPNLKFEIILLDFLFDSDRERPVPLEDAVMIASCLIDLQIDFRDSVADAFLTQVLRNPACETILGIAQPPAAFPQVTIKAPVPWKSAIQLASNRLDQVLMNYHPVLQAINLIWYELYDDLTIVNTKSALKIAPDSVELTKIVEKYCEIAREILLSDWLPRVADLIESMQPVWRNLIARKSSHGGRATFLFNAIHALMSLQVQGLIKKSVEQFYKTLQLYSNGNQEHALNPENAHSSRQPIMTLRVSVVGKTHSSQAMEFKEESVLNENLSEDPNIRVKKIDFPQPAALPRVEYTIEHHGKLRVEPYIELLPEIFVNYFKNILRVGSEIPRMEFFMSRDPNEIGYLHYIREDHVDMQILFSNVRRIIFANQDGPRLYLKPIYEYYYQLLSGNLLNRTEGLFLEDTIPSLSYFQTLMDTFNELMFEAYYLRSYVPLNMFMLDNRNLNEVLVHMVNDMKKFVTDYFRTKNLVENRKLCDEFEEISLNAGERPKETPEVVALQNYLNECRDEKLFSLKNDIKLVAERVMFLLHYATLDAEDIHLNSRTFLWPTELEQVLDLSAARLSVVREGLENTLRERRADFELELLEEKKKVDAFRSKEIRDVLSLDELKEKVETVNMLCGILQTCASEAAAINTDENLLQIDQSSFPILNELVEKMDPIEKLWQLWYRFDSKYETWFYGPFAKLDATEIRAEVEDMSNIIGTLSRILVTNPQAKRTAEQIRIKIDKFKVYLPILEGICRDGLSDRHWKLISAELGQPVTPESYQTLASLVEIDILRITEQLLQISNAAAKEFELNNQLLEMKSEWTSVMFDITQYRDSDTMILASLDDIQTLLDDHILKAQAMRGSPYISALGEKATNWEEKLISMQDILDVWVKVQSTWMYLEPIFNSEDIMRQMPVEGRNFKSVDRVWRKIMKHTEMDKRVIQTTDYPDMLATLQKAHDELEAIQKGLNMYLEKKRLFFSRFYFLSNDELLEILSETKDPLRVQPHLKKCFEGINSLQFDQNMEIIGLISSDGETVPLTKKINPATANGLVEKWLKEVQLVMVESLQEQLHSAHDVYYASVRKNWYMKWSGQVVQTICNLTWSSDVQEAILGSTLTSYLAKCESQLEESVSLNRSGISNRSRTTVQAVIVQEIHNVDVLRQLIEKDVTSVVDFLWISQLRYYWRTDEADKIEYIFVSMVMTEIKYGLEYLGNYSRIIMIPDTDRCFRTLMNAIKFNLAGCLEGPPGAGKTDTCKDLAKAVGKKMVVFNCAEDLNNRAIGKFLKGQVQSGCWICFDDFNRINVQVLSVVGQLILTIQRAVAKKSVKFQFEESTLKLDPTFAIFVTINPNSTHANKLPDNLRARFRTVALPVPDIQQIVELTLYSVGFISSHLLAVQFMNILQLCSPLLSFQYHYDFGMRSAKTILVKMIQLKASSKGNMTEWRILHRAIKDMVTPQLVNFDEEVFEKICSDLLEQTDEQPDANSVVKECIEMKMSKRNLNVIPWFVQKVLQLYEMLSLRHGIILLGEPMCGKTTCYQLLMETLKDLSLRPLEITEMSVASRIINPKSIPTQQLFGATDLENGEWQDGVLAKTFRSMANSNAPERQWIIFDGPIDEIWMENLNTVLDDNKKLCLMSGEIIQMTDSMTLLFETTDLKHASPATISRCGIIYMDREKIGWKSIHLATLNDLRQLNVSDNNLHLYQVLVDWLVEPGLEILSGIRCVLKVTPMFQYKTMRKLFKYFVANQTQYNATWFQQLFLFCWIWAYFAIISSDCKKEVDSQIRRILYGSNEKYPKPKIFTLNRGQIFPEKLNFMDYRFDGVETWLPWLRSDEQNLSTDLPAIDVFVHTMESCSASYWVDLMIKLEMPLLFVGPTGSGKTAMVKNFLRNLPKEKFLVNTIGLSARTSSKRVQDLIMSKLDRRRKGVFGPAVGRKCLIFLDDLAICEKDMYDSQPPLELIRQWADHKYWSDPKDTSRLELIDLLFVSAMRLTGGSNHIYERLYHHMFVVAIDAIENATIQRIYNTIGEWHFSKDYPEVLLKQAKALCSAILEVYTFVKQTFLPSPQKVHYQFSIEEVSRIYQGICMLPSKRLQDSEKLVRLWAHEIFRVIGDRLIDPEERGQLFNTLQNVCSTKLRMSLSQAFGEKVKGSERLSELHMRDLIFGHFMEPDADPKIYDEVCDGAKLEKVIQFYLNEYNSTAKTPINLVLFHFALEHIARVSRILQMPRGNVLLFGLGGSGRRSIAKLAIALSDSIFIQPQVTKSYDYANWTEDMKRVLLSAGMDLKKTVLLFSDNQAKDERFFEDIHYLLSSYDLNHVFAPDEKAAILDKMQSVAKAMQRNIESTSVSLYGLFTERVSENARVVLVFSSVGSSLRDHLRTYPSLRNNCSQIFFSEWPRDALVRVAEHYISGMNLAGNMKMQESPRRSVRSSQSESPSRNVGDVKSAAVLIMEQKLVDMAIYFNKTTVSAAKKMYTAMGRSIYLAPKLYLELLYLFQRFYCRKLEEITSKRDRYMIGLEKLENAANEVEVMQRNLLELQPQLKILSEETERIMVNIERETAEAEKKKEVVGADEAAANEAAASAQAIKDDCESDLQEAIPALDAALSALDTLKPADITVVKSMKNPPLGVKLVLEAVCVIKGIKADRRTDPTGKTTEDFWAPSLRMLGDMKFLESLKAFDKDHINPTVMKRIRERFIVDREFVPDKIKSISMACEGLCRWVRAMEVYDRVAKIVAPKKLALAAAEAELAQQMEKLNAKRAELQEILDKLQKLNDYFAEKSREKKRLEDEIDNCEKKLFRAERLLGGLGGEKIRWSEKAAELNQLLGNVVADVLLAAGCVSLLGPFTTEFRTNIINEWMQKCQLEQIPCSTNFNLIEVLGDPIAIRSWALNGLPSDPYSINNAIILTNARRFSLMIDPQGQANKWIKNLEKGNELQVIQPIDSNCMEILETAIIQGHSVLLENVENSLDLALHSILEGHVLHQADGQFIWLGDKLIEYNSNFRLYMTTNVRNPVFDPETAVLVTVLNFIITEVGLKDQLLAAVVNQEKPELQEKKESLLVESAQNRDLLYQIETQILQVLSSSEGNILEDENAINILSSSKVISEQIEAKQLSAEATEAEIDIARQIYLPVAKHSATLFFCIMDLGKINHMYQFSLAWYVNLFTFAIDRSPKNNATNNNRMQEINRCFTKSVYLNISRSLYEKDKLVFSFLMAVGVLRSKNEINEEALNIFLSGPEIPVNSKTQMPIISGLDKDRWNDILRLSSIDSFKDLPTDIISNAQQWSALFSVTVMQDSLLPEKYRDMDKMSYLTFFKYVRPDAVIPAVKQFILLEMGADFIIPPAFDIKASFELSSPTTPLLFLISPGSDPMGDILSFSQSKNMLEKCKSMSLGEDQSLQTRRTFENCMQMGHWIVLQNCHLCRDQLDELEQLLMRQAVTESSPPIHREFRMWCTSLPDKGFPISILQNSVKMTNESPLSLKMNISKIYNSDMVSREHFLEKTPKTQLTSERDLQYQHLILRMVLFYSLLQCRRQFGSIGFNFPYEFSEGDLRLCITQLFMVGSTHANMPLKADTFLEEHFGGRVVDPNDRRLFLALLDHMCTGDAFGAYSDSYKTPNVGRESILKYIADLPMECEPQLFGFHPNAHSRKSHDETNYLLTKLAIVQPHIEIETSRLNLLSKCENIAGKLPEPFNEKTVSANYPISAQNSLNIVLNNEVLQYNRIRNCISNSLQELIRLLKCEISENSELESIQSSLKCQVVPEIWIRNGYNTKKTVTSFIADFLDRLKFFKSWIEDGEPTSLWISAFFCPQGLFAAIRWNTSRRLNKTLDEIHIRVQPTSFESRNRHSCLKYSDFCRDNLRSNADFKCFYGLYLEGGRWNRDEFVLDECLDREVYDYLPIFSMLPVTEKTDTQPANYDCPVYKTTDRQGFVTCAGYPTNFVMYMLLPCKLSSAHFLMRGCAAFCQLD